jgi:sodium transport system permease protein
LALFALGRLLSAGHPPAPATGLIIGLSTLAAIAEEALFRRVAYAVLLPACPACAVVGSALLFGLAHVTVYGWWAFPLDVAAGLVFGWQRWASGTWAAPAITHALADLLVVI